MGAQKKILVVNHDEASRNTCVQWLTTAGYEVIVAADGESGYQSAEHNAPQLIVADALAPKMEGAQLLKKIKASSFGEAIKFLAISDREKMRESFDLLGAQGFLLKSATQEEFLDAVKRILDEDNGSREHVYKRVLIVGRYEDCIAQMRVQMEEEGCHTDFVLFGEQVISKAVLFLPNVIIMESRMIDMSSSSIIRILRQMPQFRKAPILIFNYFHASELQNTNIQQEELAMSLYVRACLDEGATESLGRYEPGSFLEKVNKYIRKGTVVAIDDDESTVRLLKKGLERKGFQVMAARDAQSGLELIQRVRPSVIILDVMMPGTDGYQLLDFVKSDPVLRRIPVMMLTVKNADEDIQKALDMGADDYMIKPFHISLFLKRLETILEAER